MGVRVVVLRVGELVALEAWMVAAALSGKDDWFAGLVVWWVVNNYLVFFLGGEGLTVNAILMLD